MAGISSAADAVGQGPGIIDGLQVLSLDQDIPFTQYTRHVMPLDGYVFWLRTQTQTVKGSLHVSIDKQQNETETMAVNRVVFSTGTEIQAFNDRSPDIMWVGEFNTIKFAFTYSDSTYKAATTFHYRGTAVLPPLLSQLVNTGDQLSDATLIVSNSLPMWLALKSYTPIWLVPSNPLITLYPSFAVPDNIAPPYGTVHIDPAGTEAIQVIPNLGPTSPVGRAAIGTLSGTTPSATHWQLTSDRVRVTLFGVTNQMALDFHDLVLSYSRDQDLLGIMGTPITKDMKRTQAELGILAMMKTIDFDVSYYQNRANDVARQLIEHVTVTYLPNDLI